MVEMSLKRAVIEFPELLGFCPPEMVKDDHYIVRIGYVGSDLKVEVGYPEDEEWSL